MSPAMGQHFIYSSQMVLQGNDSEELQPASPAASATYLGLWSPPAGHSTVLPDFKLKASFPQA